MKTLFIYLSIIGAAFAQSYGTYANLTNGAPVAHTSWMRSGLSYENALGDPTLILYMPMSYPLDKAYDYSSNGLSSAFTGNGSGTLPYKYFIGCGQSSLCPALGSRGAYFFNSNVNSLVTPSITLPSSFTFNVWVNASLPTADSYQRVLETKYTNGFYLGTDAGTTTKHWQIIVNSSVITNCVSTTALPTGTFSANWVMLTATYSSGVAALYINGSLASMTGSCSYTAPSVPTQALTIGCAVASCNSGSAFNGGIEDLRLYNRILPAAEIAAIYAAETVFH